MKIFKTKHSTLSDKEFKELEQKAKVVAEIIEEDEEKCSNCGHTPETGACYCCKMD